MYKLFVFSPDKEDGKINEYKLESINIIDREEDSFRNIINEK